MDRENRKKQILHALESNEYIAVRELVSSLGVSHMTVRRDLSELESRGYLIRKYGGAVKSEAIDNLFSFERRVYRNRRQKEAICRMGAGYIRDNDVIFVDCGTTLFRLCHHVIDRKNLRLITNSLPVVSELINYSNIKVSLVGGELVHERKAIYGSLAETAIGEFHADKAFIGADGVSVKKGLSSYDDKEGNISRLMAENADTVFLLCDSSKVEKDSCFRWAPLNVIDYLITDPGLDKKYIDLYRKHDIEVIRNMEGENYGKRLVEK
jgi:DeoR family fructose operon transcriptional repressor